MSETDDELLKERGRRMLDHCEMSNVRVLEFSAKRFDEHSEPAIAHITSEISYLVNEDVFLNRFMWKAELVDNSAAPVAELNATLWWSTTSAKASNLTTKPRKRSLARLGSSRPTRMFVNSSSRAQPGSRSTPWF